MYNAPQLPPPQGAMITSPALTCVIWGLPRHPRSSAYVLPRNPIVWHEKKMKYSHTDGKTLSRDVMSETRVQQDPHSDLYLQYSSTH